MTQANRHSLRRRRAACAFALAASSVFLVQSAAAQEFPSKPVTLVVPFPPGSGPDFIARVISEKLSPKLGQPILVESRPGAGGLAGANVVARAAPDGYTLLVTPNTVVISSHVLTKGAGGGVDVLKDLVPVIKAAAPPLVLATNPQLGVKTPADLIAAAKRNPGLAYASAGNGSPQHFAGELFKKATGVDMLHVPYKGQTPSVTDTIAGQVKVLFVALSGVMGHIRSGKLVPLAVAEKQRTSIIPELPTLAEFGIKGVEVDAWLGVLAPAGTPIAIIARWNQEINAVVKMPDVRARLNGLGIDARGGTPEEFGATMREDHERYGRIAQEFGIKAD